MIAHVLNSTLNPMVEALAVVAVTAAAAWRTWVNYRRAVVHETARTSRLTRAIDGASPRERAEIIRACSLLEGATRYEPDAPDHEEGPAAKPRARRSERRPLVDPTSVLARTVDGCADHS